MTLIVSILTYLIQQSSITLDKMYKACGIFLFVDPLLPELGGLDYVHMYMCIVTAVISTRYCAFSCLLVDFTTLLFV